MKINIETTDKNISPDNPEK